MANWGVCRKSPDIALLRYMYVYAISIGRRQIKNSPILCTFRRQIRQIFKTLRIFPLCAKAYIFYLLNFSFFLTPLFTVCKGVIICHTFSFRYTRLQLRTSSVYQVLRVGPTREVWQRIGSSSPGCRVCHTGQPNWR